MFFYFVHFVHYFVCLFVDVASNRKMLKALLNRNGVLKVDTVENGLEAVEATLANMQKYDMIFMDNHMPVMVTN